LKAGYGQAAIAIKYNKVSDTTSADLRPFRDSGQRRETGSEALGCQRDNGVPSMLRSNFLWAVGLPVPIVMLLAILT
jgi:hypothetical protein